MKRIVMIVALLTIILIDLYIGISSYIEVNSVNGLCNPDNWTTGLMEVTCMSKNYGWNIIHLLITVGVLIRVSIKPTTIRFAITSIVILLLLLYPFMTFLLTAMLYKFVIVAVIIIIVFKVISKKK